MALASDPYIWGTGQFTVNGKPVDEFFTTPSTLVSAVHALIATESRQTYDIAVNVCGGGTTGQADAGSLGVARALQLDNPQFEPVLREHHLLTRDPRMVERKKYGLRKARRATQFSKR